MIKYVFGLILIACMSVNTYAQTHTQAEALYAYIELDNLIDDTLQRVTDAATSKTAADNVKSALNSQYSGYLASDYATDASGVTALKTAGDGFHSDGVDSQSTASSQRGNGVSKLISSWIAYDTFSDWDTAYNDAVVGYDLVLAGDTNYAEAITNFDTAYGKYIDALAIIHDDAYDAKTWVLTNYDGLIEDMNDLIELHDSLFEKMADVETAIEAYYNLYGETSQYTQAMSNYDQDVWSIENVIETYDDMYSLLVDVVNMKAEAATYSTNNPTDYVGILDRYGAIIDKMGEIQGNFGTVWDGFSYADSYADAALGYVTP